MLLFLNPPPLRSLTCSKVGTMVLSRNVPMTLPYSMFVLPTFIASSPKA